MIKTICFIVGSCLLISWIPRADFASTSNPGLLWSPPNSELELITSVVAEEYCNEDQLRITLELEFKNTGDKKIILYRYSVAVVRTLVSRSLETASAKQFEEDTQYLVNLIADPDQIDGSAPSDSFVVLEANDSYRTKTRVVLLLPRGDKGIGRKLRPANYSLQVVVPTWYLSDDLAKKLRKRWESLGSLWTSDVISRPMAFEIEDRDSIGKCSP